MSAAGEFFAESSGAGSIPQLVVVDDGVGSAVGAALTVTPGGGIGLQTVTTLPDADVVALLLAFGLPVPVGVAAAEGVGVAAEGVGVAGEVVGVGWTDDVGAAIEPLGAASSSAAAGCAMVTINSTVIIRTSVWRMRLVIAHISFVEMCVMGSNALRSGNWIP